MDRKFYTYIITNITNGKIYIGKTVNPNKRWKDHLKISKGGPNKYKRFQSIHGAIKKYGEDKFDFKIINEYNSEQESLAAEIELISLHKSNDRKIGYNLTKGGEGVIGYTFTDAAKLKISNAHKGKILSEEHKKNISTTLKLTSNIRSKMNQGENGSNAKLTETQVIEIKKMLKSGMSNRQIAKLFGVGKSCIGDISSGRCWSHI
jgi:group I intron endonuclease